MSELDLFRDFRGGVAAPSDDARQRAAARLASAIEGQPWSGAKVLRPIRRRPGRAALAMAALVGAIAAALFVSSPWKTAPALSFSLEQVQAAITPPEGTILHAAWTVTRTSREFGCTVTLGPNELWADLSPPYRYREIGTLASGGADRRSAACDESESATTEVGGTPGTALRFVPPDRLALAGPGWTGGTRDDVATLREALRDGTARDEGEVELDGRAVQRIRVDIDPGPRSVLLTYYVDRETFKPVRVEAGRYVFSGPPCDWVFCVFDVVRDYLTYDYLPRTDKNLALTDIWEQHPDAVGPPGVERPRDLPTLTGAVAMTVHAAESAKSARVTFEVTATDDEGRDIDVSCQPPSGSRFPVGETIVRCWAIDSSGNTAYEPFTVTIEN